MTEANNDPTKEIVEELSSDQTGDQYPGFIDESEKVPFELQSEVAEFKRQSNADRTPNSLVDGIGEESGIWHFRERNIQMLKVRLDTGSAVYVPQNEVGSQFKHLDVLVGKRVKLAVVNLQETDTVDENNNPEYVAIGSIKQAEYLIGKALFDEFESADDTGKEDFLKKKRLGTITDVIDTPELQMVFFTYQGMALAMYADQFTYRTYAQPLSDVARIGDSIAFQITNITKTRYEELDLTKERHAFDIAPKGDRFFIRTTCLPFRENPLAKVKRLQKNGGACIARIVRYNPVKGILVEIAPGWWIRGILSDRAPYKPSVYDELAHTPVSVRIRSLDTKNRWGVCQIIAFPQGVARSAYQEF